MISLKKPKTILTIILIIFVSSSIICSFVIFGIMKTVSFVVPSEESLIETQLRELDDLRKTIAPLTEAETKKQLEEMDKLRKTIEPLTEAETKKQLEEMDKLREKFM